MDDSTKKVLSRLDELDKKYEKKLDLICEESNTIGNLEDKLERIDAKLDKKFNTIDKKLEETSGLMSEISANLNGISNSCQRILEKLDKFEKLFMVQIILSLIIGLLIGGFLGFIKMLL